MRQLKMRRYSAPVVKRELPAGYSYASFSGSEAEITDWLYLCSQGILPDTDRKHWVAGIEQHQNAKPMEDVHFVVDARGKRVATISSIEHAGKEGYIHMVAALPECRGKGIGHASLSYALEILEARGCTSIYLTTDDFRLGAIKTYLDAGFRPVLYHDPDSDMRARWAKVFADLSYAPVPFIEE